ncbi:MAG: phytanoyl-CoA dioxygenase family protein [Chloroflexota bacterium]|nr:phytanoyl-CoA dioxygenase family protein [Chloroflexota bacterium]
MTTRMGTTGVNRDSSMMAAGPMGTPRDENGAAGVIGVREDVGAATSPVPVTPPKDYPLYPTAGRERQNHGDALSDLTVVEQVSNTDEQANTLSRVAATYPGVETPAVMEPGDVAFFGGHILHRSHRNRSVTRFRRSFVGHYANARSYTQWGHGGGDSASTNDQQILARGGTHLPYAQPRFGTACAANTPELYGRGLTDGQAMMSNMADGDMMGTAPMDMARNDPAHHDHDAE